MLKKVMAWVLVVTLTAGIAIGGTLAYLTDRDSEANVFTTGDVDITLNDDFQQESQLKPGVEIEKNISIKNEGPNEAYVWYTYAVPQGLEQGLVLSFEENTKWSTGELIGTKEVDGVTYNVYVSKYSDEVPAGTTTDVGLTKVTMDPAVDITPEGDAYLINAGVPTDLEWNIYDTEKPVIFINAYAIQTQDFANVGAAYDAFKGQWGNMVDAGTYEVTDTWDGTADTTWYNDTDTEFALSTAEEFAGFVELANAGNTFSGKTIELENSIDLNGEEWTAIKQFSGDLNGNGHEISNFSVDAASNRGGLFTKLEWATIKDLTLSDIDATVGARFGTLTYSVNQTTIENVNVSGINIVTTHKDAIVGGLFCAGTVNSTETVNNCTVENITVDARKGAALIGGIATFVQKNGTEAEGTNIFDNLHVKNFKVIANDTDKDCGIGGIFAQTQSVWQNPRFNNCTVTGLDVTATGTVDVGGFMCYPGSWTYAENCTVEGKIDVSGVTAAANYAGGFFGDYGWGDNVGKGDHKVTNCSADVDITTKVASAGGFVGSGTNSERKNKNITLTNCEAKGTVTLVDGGTANIGGFAGQTDRGIYVNCSAAQAPFIGKVLDGYTLNDDGNGTLTVTKN